MDVGCRIGNICLARLPDLAHLPEHLQETATPITIVRRKVSSAEKWLQLGREKYIERPAAGAGRRLNEGHVYLVHVGPFLAIDFNADKIRIEEFCGFFALERF